MFNGFSVIMPTFNHASFIRRAILSLQKQTYTKWELIIVNDGCTDKTEEYLFGLLADPQITYIKNEKNRGLGYALNQGLNRARYDYIAYLPSDDFYYENHLESLRKKIEQYEDIVLVYSGMKFATTDTMNFFPDNETKRSRRGYYLQLVQTAHKKTADRWVERDEWVTEDLYLMFWNKLLNKGAFVATQSITCFWTNHPFQRHKIIAEKYRGGLNYYRLYYQVDKPIKLRVSKYKFTDEEYLYKDFRARVKPAQQPLKILLVGELAYNSERIYALEEAGHKLYGLWVQRPPFSFNAVGPVPFGHIEDIPFNNWEKHIRKIQPDIIYALLNFSAVPLACLVLKKNPDIPFVWHFKEGPSVCLNNGVWNDLVYLYTYADGKIYINQTVKDYYDQFTLPGKLTCILDGDLPKQDHFQRSFSKRLSESDGAIHTIVAGRMIGISPFDMNKLASHNIHIHLYSENYHEERVAGNNVLLQAAPKHFHIHPHCSHLHWVEELSQYDAAWLHCFESKNNGDLLKISWDDLNIPARINTYMAAGLPIIQRNNAGHIVATQQRIEELNIGILFNDYDDLSGQLKNRRKMEQLRENVMKHRMLFSFDYHVPGLIAFFRKVIQHKNNKYGKDASKNS
jgi:glycosyltransferase involved in cell wall biosynthesis